MPSRCQPFRVITLHRLLRSRPLKLTLKRALAEADALGKEMGLAPADKTLARLTLVEDRSGSYLREHDRGHEASTWKLRDELLARYEGGVWTFLVVVGLALLGIVVWIGLLVL